MQKPPLGRLANRLPAHVWLQDKVEETPVPRTQAFAGWRLPEEGSEARFPGQAGARLTVELLLRQSSALGSERHPSCPTGEALSAQQD